MNKSFSKNDTLTAKGLAVLLLLFYHLFYEEHVLTALQVNYAPIPGNVFLMAAGFGNICVAVFVMITAYGITKSILNDSAMTVKAAYDLAWKRFLKLMAGFAGLYLSVILVWSRSFDLQSLYGKGKQGLLLMICDGLGLSQVFGTPTLNDTWWYMALAYTFIFLIPVLAFGVKKTGVVLLAFSFFAPMIFRLTFDMARYFFVAVFGVCAAYGNWFEKMFNLRMHGIVKWCVGVLGLVLCVLIRQNAVVKDYFANYVDAPIAFFVICFAVMLPGMIPGVKQVLQYMGKHSMNIYLVHSFFYLIIHRSFIYGFRHAGIIFLALVLVSLGYSMIFEGLRKLIWEIWSRIVIRWKNK